MGFAGVLQRNQGSPKSDFPILNIGNHCGTAILEVKPRLKPRKRIQGLLILRDTTSAVECYCFLSSLAVLAHFFLYKSNKCSFIQKSRQREDDGDFLSDLVVTSPIAPRTHSPSLLHLFDFIHGNTCPFKNFLAGLLKDRVFLTIAKD